MAIWACTGCGSQFAVGLLRCPHCQKFSGYYDVKECIRCGTRYANARRYCPKCEFDEYHSVHDTDPAPEPPPDPPKKRRGRPPKNREVTA